MTNAYARAMLVMLKLVLDCDVDAAWHALRSPAVFREVVAPWLDFDSADAGGFPTRWTPGPHHVDALAFGAIPVGHDIIDLSFDRLPDGVRMVSDTGGGRTGLMAALTSWHHRMAVSAAPDGRTLYRDRLEFGAGGLGIAAWYPTWAFWQWRGIRLRQLAPGWRHDIGVDVVEDAP